ncbi:hypothetical protein SAMN05443633_102344 [Chryseobacterium arachidis]|uniref:DUF4595 domain-containing protein n=1 Tax=Chryseobacterium arachidis TaxID=1416778 RepID=A0A1M4XIU0_9FLAO|nr:hypothetical protein [Chryseobacterium arachidis]SHE93425.1 hypothetical protein SAMN05443633_102344 [Chryseobacterium arachidis]
MTKKYFLSTLAAVALGFVVSCDNTTDDPPNQNNNNGSSGNTITGPRILAKINSKISATETKDTEEYITNTGILSQAFLRDAGSSNMTTATVTYSGDKISKIRYIDNVNPHVIDNTYNLTYTSGKLTSFTMDQTIVTTTTHSDFEVIYDANGQLYRIIEKKKMGSANYTHYAECKFTFSASNVVKLDYTTMLMSGGSTPTPDASTSSTMTYAYENYDSKINPYTTLPKEYFMVINTLFPINFSNISSNNMGKLTMYPPTGSPISIPKGYLYDSQNFPVSDQGQAMKYIYKPL